MTASTNALDMPTTYDPKAVERHITEKWLAGDPTTGTSPWHADPNADGDPFAVVIPPPNVTAALHLGHALNNTLQDVLVRHARMTGKKTLWMPGTDHAGIATQTVVDKRLQASGEKSIKEYKLDEAAGKGGRDAFISKVQAWKDEYEQRITEQLVEMGCSCDWDRQRFTMDDVCAAAVREAFFQLFKDGLIYRGKRLVNWDPVTQTALADDEVEMQDVDGNFYYMKYPVCDSAGELTGEFVTVATTRPETMLGDTAVAVNPKDVPRAKYIGQFVKLPIANRIIPIIGDDYVVIPDPDSDDAKAKMASGFLKVTPAHDPNDYAIGQRHDLPQINVMAPDASISKDHGWPEAEWPDSETSRDREGAGSSHTTVDQFAHELLGQSREDARKAIVIWFKDHDLMGEIKPYRHAVGHSYRSHVPIEPYLSDQWYVKVTNDRLAGAALRAMAPDQRTATSRDREGAGSTNALTSRDREGAGSTNALTSRDREGAGSIASTGSETAYLITFSTYGSWLHGDERGSVDMQHNVPGTPVLEPDRGFEHADREQITGPPFELNADRRSSVLSTVTEVCRHRGWRLDAVNVRTRHVHVVVTAKASPETVMNDLKAYATRRMRESGLAEDDVKIWARHGSTRYLNESDSFDVAVRYVVDEQGDDLDSVYDGRKTPLPDGRGSSEPDPAPSRSRLVDGELRFHPERYAKTFQTWHENIRDWCISRQLWWGHRIPVWSFEPIGNDPDVGVNPEAFKEELESRLNEYARLQGKADDSFAVTVDLNQWKFFICCRREASDYLIDRIAQQRVTASFRQPGQGVDSNHAPVGETAEQRIAAFKVLRMAREFTRDPDVLDTWFSSALWPMSTMGWPDPDKFVDPPADGSPAIPEGDDLLKAFNPSSVLCTAREIITLWVSRMVMFNLYFRNCLPFTDVFIHAMIQDGHGQKMSKSLGNGVDPMDIIHSHGSDAMRFTLTQMTTQTQDVRLPVDMVDPHTGETFTPEFVTASGGVKVAAPIQERNGKKMVSSYGLASGKAEPTDDMPLARNTSEKFDIGMRFTNKLWNASRFALSNLSETSRDREGAGSSSLGTDQFSIVDRWMLSRTAEVIEQVDAFIASYDYHNYAQTMYHYFWGDVCDWYIEAVKPVITKPEGAAARRVLATVLDVSLRLLHPAMPFVTERIWEAMGQMELVRGVPGLELPVEPMLATSAWPSADASVVDKQAQATFTQLQDVVTAIREARATAKLKPSESVEVSIKVAGDVAGALEPMTQLIESLANVTVAGLAADVAPPANAAVTVKPIGEVYLHIAVDVDAERDRLTKKQGELNGRIKSLQGRLNNEKYVSKAPAKLVQESRDQLAAAEAELESIERQLSALS